MKKKFSQVVLVTGGFDPIHSGHIAYLSAAKKISDYLVVGINSDDWLLNKKGYFFMPYQERKAVIENLKMVNQTIDFDDSDGTAVEAIKRCKKISEKVFFANGGDRGKSNTPEQDVCEKLGVELLWGIGGDYKADASSDLVNRFRKKADSNKVAPKRTSPKHSDR